MDRELVIRSKMIFHEVHGLKKNGLGHGHELCQLGHILVATDLVLVSWHCGHCGCWFGVGSFDGIVHHKFGGWKDGCHIYVNGILGVCIRGRKVWKSRASSMAS
jgi:hypothetical protein